MSNYNNPVTVVCLLAAGALSVCVSFIGLAILSIGEACCNMNESGGWAYFFFGALLTIAAGIVLGYGLKKPPMPSFVWAWFIAIVLSAEVMQLRGSNSPSEHGLGSLLSQLLMPQVWVPALIVVLCQVEAFRGSRKSVSNTCEGGTSATND